VSRTIRLLLTVAVATTGTTGCLDWEDDQVQFGEDFEGCGGCSWTFEGDVTIVSTVHPGEHAARLGGGARMQHPLQIQRAVDNDDVGYSQDGFTDGNWLEYSSDCTGRPALALEPLGAGVQVRLRIEGPPEHGFTRRRLMFPALPPGLAPPPDWSTDPYAEPWTFMFGNLVVESAAPCRVDNLRIMVSGGTVAY